VDAVRLVGKVLARMISREPGIMQSTFRNGKVLNNGTEGIDCDADPVVPWRHGYDIMKTLREVRPYRSSSGLPFSILYT
jgi:hypothetical protein